MKAQTVRLNYRSPDGEQYVLNLMDTPGHVDFTYEVSRCLAACEGALLLVDAAQGVEAQTLANCYLAMERDIVLIAVINKIDLPAADPVAVTKEIENLIGITSDNIINISAKNGEGITQVLDKIVARVPPPTGEESQPLKAMLIDSWYNPYRGVMVLARVYQGRLTKGDKIMLCMTGAKYSVEDLGIFSPRAESCNTLGPGEIGWLSAGMREVAECHIGDTITSAARPCKQALAGFKTLRPVVFCGFFPDDAADIVSLRKAVEHLSLNDTGFSFKAEHSMVLGSGFRCGFLGLLHLDIVRSRLIDEYNVNIVVTAPSVSYRVELTSGERREINNPSDFPEASSLNFAEEPWVKATIVAPSEYIGSLIKFLTQRRGNQLEIQYIGADNSLRAILVYELPLAEIVFDFHDRVKSMSRGYASFDYEIGNWRQIELVKLDVLVNGEAVEALGLIIPKTQIDYRARQLCERLKDLIPRQLFRVAIQAAVGGRIVARETVGALRKDVTAKCYGGDITRKRKLLEKQKKGKKKMMRYGNVEIPPETFVKVLTQN